MGENVTYKILKGHLVSGSLVAGEPISIKIDQTLTQDATGTMAYLQFESLELDKVKNELAVSYVDHNTVQVGFENFDDHEYLRTVAANKGVVYSKAGNGICHQVQLERFAIPGKTLLGSDSHTPTQGGLCEIAIGAGGLDVALAMAAIPFSLICPKVIGIKLTGSLRPGVSAKDIILKVLEKFGVKGNVNTAFEYFGPAVKTLSVPERATICNMGAECGVTFSIFPSDERTKEFLDAHGRGTSFKEIRADEDAIYDDVYEIDLSVLEPLVALPHSPGNISSVKAIEGMKVNQILIGSCTNSSYMDLKKVASILKGKTVHPEVSFAIAPGSREVLEMICQDGSLDIFIKAGARILESACGFCIGNHQSPGTNGVSLRTSNRNFEGRSGTKSAKVYLVSPETSAVSAIYGELRSPLNNVPYSSIELPKKYYDDDSMIIFPPEDGRNVEILRGPNIGEPPKTEALKETLKGKALIKVQDKITTDHIMPAGARLKYRSNIAKYSEFVFESIVPTFSERALDEKAQGRDNFIIAGASYGQGSSREHAAICPAYLGVKAVIAKSIERIHQANLCNFGILPLLFEREEDYDEIQEGDDLEISNVHSSLEKGIFILKDLSLNKSFALKLFASSSQKEMLEKGGRLNQIKGL